MTNLRNLVTFGCLFSFAVGSAAEEDSGKESPWVAPPLMTPDQTKAFVTNLPYDSITLERTPCFGSCPVYSVTLYRSGKAEFHAVKNLPKIGDFSGRIDVTDFGRLCYFIQRTHFSEFKENYRANWTDDTTCIVTARTPDNKIKKVSDYGTVGPIQLWAIQQLIDGFRERIEWTPK